MAVNISQTREQAQASRRQRAEESRSLANDIRNTKRRIMEHLDENPGKILRVYSHMLAMSSTEPVAATARLSLFALSDLLDDKPFDSTYHVHGKVPEYFQMSWLQNQDPRCDAVFFGHLKHGDKKMSGS